MALRHDPGGMPRNPRREAGVSSDLVVLGYDARERWCPRERLWPDERCAHYLLRPDIERPLSADVLVWPSVFVDAQLDLLDLEDLRIGSAGLPAPDMRGWVQLLWSDLGSLRRALSGVDDRPHDIVAITAPAPWHFDVPASSPAAPSDDWVPLGYDVVDGWLLSGLSNCGYLEEDDIEGWRSRWARYLNDRHLFDDRVAADAFAAATSNRVREHAPFLACRIWKVH